MLIDTNVIGGWRALVALDGELVGPLSEAFVASQEEGGYVIKADDPSRTRHVGRVDFLGVDGDPPEMLAARLFSIRQHLGKRPYDDLLGALDAKGERELRARMLEGVARRLRRDEVVPGNISQSSGSDRFPLPNDEWQHVRDGKMAIKLEYVDKAVHADYLARLEAWTAAHPDLVPEYVRARPDLPIKK